jgi:hypothetical protein
MPCRCLAGAMAHDGYCNALVEAQMILMALMLLVIIVAYLLMLGLVKFAEGVIDKGQQTALREAPLSGAKTSARSI